MSFASKIWFNYWQPEFKQPVPSFYDNAKLPWAIEIEKNWPSIKEEISSLIQKKESEFQTYFGSGRDTGSTGWKTITLKTWGIDVKENLDQCPTLKKMISTTPGWTSAAISLLEPNTSIKSHQGDTDAIYRAHLGISIPDQLPKAGLKVNNEEKGWEEGKLVIFLDAHWHEAWNQTNEKRLIMILDVVREEYISQSHEICIRVRAFLLLQILTLKMPSLMKLPKFLHKILFCGVCSLLEFIYPYQKKFGVIRKHA